MILNESVPFQEIRSRTKDVIFWEGWAIIHPSGLLMSPPACTHMIVVADIQLQTLEAEDAHARHGHESAGRAVGWLAPQRLSTVPKSTRNREKVMVMPLSPGGCGGITPGQHPVSILTPLASSLRASGTQPTDGGIVDEGRLGTFRKGTDRLLVPSSVWSAGFILLPAHLVLPRLMRPGRFLRVAFLAR